MFIVTYNHLDNLDEFFIESSLERIPKTLAKFATSEDTFPDLLENMSEEGEGDYPFNILNVTGIYECCKISEEKIKSLIKAGYDCALKNHNDNLEYELQQELEFEKMEYERLKQKFEK